MSTNGNEQETPEPSEKMQLNEIYYNCTECASLIEILDLNERKNIIEFKCLNRNNPHKRKMPIIEFLNKMKKYNNKNINNDICITHNKKYDCYCLDCNIHLCKDCLKQRKHIKNFKSSIEEIQPDKDELYTMEKIIKYYEDKIDKLERGKISKKYELDNKLQIYKKKLKEKKEIKMKENDNKLEKELKRNNDKYINDISNIKKKYLNEIKKRKRKYEMNIKEIKLKFNLIKEKENIIYKNKIENLDKKFLKVNQQYGYNKKIDNMKNINRVNEIIYNAYNNYNNNYYNSININNILMKHYNNKQIDSNLFELIKPNEPSIEDFKEELIKIPNYEQEYPLLYYCFIEDKNKEKDLIKYLPDINKFVNFMIDKYSYKITRLKHQELN